MAIPNEPGDPGKSLRWYWDQCRRGWTKTVEADSAFHKALYGRFPRAMWLGGTTLRGFYDICVSPAFAVILSLLLVGLVISGVVPVIVSISVFFAWLVAILSVARNAIVNRLRIAERFCVVFGIAAIMALGANRYVKWCLVNYYKNQPPLGAGSRNDTDKLAYQRFKELIDEEVPKFVQPGPANTKMQNPPRADLILEAISKPVVMR